MAGPAVTHRSATAELGDFPLGDWVTLGWRVALGDLNSWCDYDLAMAFRSEFEFNHPITKSPSHLTPT